MRGRQSISASKTSTTTDYTTSLNMNEPRDVTVTHRGVRCSLGKRNLDRHRSALLGLPLDHGEHGEDNPRERTLHLDLLRRGIELEVLHKLREEGLHLDESGVVVSLKSVASSGQRRGGD